MLVSNVKGVEECDGCGRAAAPPAPRDPPPPRYPLQLEIEEMRTEETEFNAARAPRPARRRPAEGRPRRPSCTACSQR